MSRKIFIGNIPHQFSQVDFEQLVQVCGPIVSCNLEEKKEEDFIKKFGFCEYKNPLSTEYAIKKLHGLTILNRNLVVRYDEKK